MYISSSQIQNISHLSYSSIIFCDHSKSPNITLKTLSTIPFRSSQWKLNDSILNSTNNIFSIKTKINHLSTSLNLIMYKTLFSGGTNLKQTLNNKLLTFQKLTTGNYLHSKTDSKQHYNTLTHNKDANRLLTFGCN